ncbi:MAG: DUF11 domain-containing protein [Gemmataceae bacterium]|nr:DUF11 domain-containing protein [Gemmataceae bacterium]
MKFVSRRCLLLLLATATCALLPACGNPSYFPYLIPPGRVKPTHAKPGGEGYFANFDPKAQRLEVRPGDTTTQVRTQLALLATVYDDQNQPRRERRVEWMIEGVGNLIEVDESGYFHNRGYKTSNKHGVSYTASHEHRIDRGNAPKDDDFMVRPGQTFAVISSAVEGDTHITSYAPGINDWEKNKVYTTIRWVDATWEFPGPKVARFGSEETFATKIFRATDRQPLANYRVRYRIMDGPAAVLLPSRSQEYVAISDLSGNATVTIAQLQPAPGINRISMEVIRPPDPTAPSGSGVVLAKGETQIEWIAPQVVLNYQGPSLAGVGSEATYTASIQNVGKIESKSMTVTAAVPEGMQFVRSTPPAFTNGQELVWTLGTLPPGQTHTIQSVYRAVRPGNATSTVSVATEEGQRDTKSVATQIVAGALKVSVNGPQNGVVGTPISFQVTVANPGDAPLENVTLVAQFDEGLEHESKVRTINQNVGTLAPRGSSNSTLVLTPRVPGKRLLRVIATSQNLSDTAETSVNVQATAMNVSIDGPQKKYVGRNVEYSIKVSNPTDATLQGVMVRDRLPAELEFVEASPSGQFVNGEAIWNLGNLGPREERTLKLVAKANQIAKQAVQIVQASTESGLKRDAQAILEIFGAPGLRLEMIDRGDPAPIGGKVQYTIEVTNTGTTPANGVEIRCLVPPQMKILSTKGPTKEAIQGPNVLFEKFDNLQPGQKIGFAIEVECKELGDVRFRTELRASSLETPVIEEESTRIYAPLAPGGNPAGPGPIPAPNPNPGVVPPPPPPPL